LNSRKNIQVKPVRLVPRKLTANPELLTCLQVKNQSCQVLRAWPVNSPRYFHCHQIHQKQTLKLLKLVN